ncbi:MAG: hypothetical protein C0469_07265 [Cyanobacteria bacterium DS2.3.42]|nr:hypothetical protein [Cyanobacteria bacterium DS2.3.42]
MSNPFESFENYKRQDLKPLTMEDSPYDNWNAIREERSNTAFPHMSNAWIGRGIDGTESIEFGLSQEEMKNRTDQFRSDRGEIANLISLYSPCSK